MRQFTESRRTARGLRELRNRYIRRAEYLCTNPEYQQKVKRVQNAWARDFPMFRFDRVLHSHPGVFPWMRLEDVPRHSDPDPRERIDFHIIAMEDGSAVWRMILERLETEFFPPMDFYALPNRRPALKFLQESMLTDPKLLSGETERFFPLESLELTMDTSEYDEIGIEPEGWELTDPWQTWYIPVYPEMTADDLKRAIPRIIEQVQTIFGRQTVGARIESLRASGKTQQEIADCLGLNVKSVQAHLREANERDTGSESDAMKLTGS